MNRLIKERYYVKYTISDDNTLVNIVIDILFHEFLDFINSLYRLYLIVTLSLLL